MVDEKLKSMDVDNGEDLTPDDIHEIHLTVNSLTKPFTQYNFIYSIHFCSIHFCAVTTFNN